MLKKKEGSIGIFDSGYGGLTILQEIQKTLPQYDYIYLGDNARTPYGTRSFDVVYRYTLEAVEELFNRGCFLVILACNTASAKALRTIQINDLKRFDSSRRVLGVIRPTVEKIGSITHNNHVGILGTTGTIQSHSYDLEISKLFPNIRISSHACPMWVPLVENKEYNHEGTDFFIKKDIDCLMAKDEKIDTIILGCTHYPILYNKIRSYLPESITLITQGKLVADSLADYLKRHTELEKKCTKSGSTTYLTTEDAHKFIESSSIFLKRTIEAKQISLT